MSFDQLAAQRAKKVGSLAREFRDFAFKGNIVDLAVGVIIGAAFTGLINGFVKNVLMPLISLAFPAAQSYTQWSFSINGKDIPYGLFLGDFVNFLIIALVLFVFTVKFLGWLRRKSEEQQAATPPLTKQELLLTEIRDLLRAGRPPAETPRA